MLYTLHAAVNSLRTGHTGTLLFCITKLVQSVERLATDWSNGVRYPTQAEDFSSTLCVQTGTGAHPASCTMGTGGSFPGGKARPGRDADCSRPLNASPPKHLSWRVAGQLLLFYFTVLKNSTNFCLSTRHSESTFPSLLGPTLQNKQKHRITITSKSLLAEWPVW
jgi:hypothetical protein